MTDFIRQIARNAWRARRDKSSPASKAAVGHERQLRHLQVPERDGRRIAAVAFNALPRCGGHAGLDPCHRVDQFHQLMRCRPGLRFICMPRRGRRCCLWGRVPGLPQELPLIGLSGWSLASSRDSDDLAVRALVGFCRSPHGGARVYVPSRSSRGAGSGQVGAAAEVLAGEADGDRALADR